MAKETKTASAITITKEETEAKQLIKDADAALKYANAIKIKTEDDHKIVVEALTRVRGKWKHGEEIRKFFTDPLNAQLKKINALFKPSIDGLKQADSVLSRKLTDYQDEIDRKAEEARLKVLSKVEERKMKVETAVKKIENIPEAQKTVRTNEGTLSYTEKPDVVVEDETKIPKKYWTLDMVAVRRDALGNKAQGIDPIEIPGVKVVIKKVPSIKSNL